MAVYSNASSGSSTAALTRTLGTTPTIGTADTSVGFWLRPRTLIVSSSNGWVNLKGTAGTIRTYQDSSTTNISPISRFGAWLYTNIILSTSSWYWIVLSRGSGISRIRIFDDSSATTPITETGSFSTASDSTNLTDLTTLEVGYFTGDLYAADADFTCLKIQTGVEWTDGECRTESKFYTIQKSGGTNRWAWALKDVTASTDGLNEIGASGENLSNNGFTTSAFTPTQLSAGSSAGFNTRIDQLGNIQTRIGQNERNNFIFV
jgi:hypothetical protein